MSNARKISNIGNIAPTEGNLIVGNGTGFVELAPSTPGPTYNLQLSGTTISWAPQSSPPAIPEYLNDLSDVQGTPSNGQVLTWNNTGSYWEPQNASGGLNNIVEDTTPQLGGSLDVNGYSILGAPAATSTSAGGNLVLAGGSGGATSGVGGTTMILGGSPQGTDQPGGAAYIFGGAPTGAGNGGPALLQGGGLNTTAANGGDASLVGGYTGSGSAGDAVIDGGRGYQAGGVPGNIRIRPGVNTIDVTQGLITFETQTGSVPPSVCWKNGSYYIALKAPSSIAANRTWMLPNDDPATASGKFLTTDASGNLSFVSGGGSTFLSLTDTPSSFTSSGGYLLRVNSGATAVEFVDGTTVFQPLDAQLTDIAGLSPTKGNVIVGNGTNFVSVGVGTNNYVLTADSAQASGVKWATVTATGDTSPTPNTLAQRDASGDLYAVNFVSSSDQTLKKDIRPIENALNIINNLEGKRFKFIDNEREQVGFIAQEVEKVLPEVVETGVDGKKFVGYANITAVLVEAIKEQNKKIEELQQLVKSLVENTTEDK